jgi:hypothetical protein
MIDLVDCISVKVIHNFQRFLSQSFQHADDKTRKRNSMEINTTDEAICMYGESSQDIEGWIGAVER